MFSRFLELYLALAADPVDAIGIITTNIAMQVAIHDSKGHAHAYGIVEHPSPTAPWSRPLAWHGKERPKVTVSPDRLGRA
jgi:hypothetical protein